MGRVTIALATLSLVCLVVGAANAESRRSLPTRRVDVAFHQADIANVLRFFAEVGRINIVYGDDVDGTVTMQLKRVRWDRALRAILRTKGLDMAWEGNIIRVAKAGAFARERQVVVDARHLCLSSSPLHTRIVRVSHARAEDVASLARATLQSERGSVTIDERTNSLIVRDTRCPD